MIFFCVPVDTKQFLSSYQPSVEFSKNYFSSLSQPSHVFFFSCSVACWTSTWRRQPPTHWQTVYREAEHTSRKKGGADCSQKNGASAWREVFQRKGRVENKHISFLSLLTNVVSMNVHTILSSLHRRAGLSWGGGGRRRFYWKRYTWV